MSKIACPDCGFANIPERRTCKQCGAHLADVTTPQSDEPLTIDERGAILDAEIRRHVGNGWRVATRTSTSAQLVKDTPPNMLIALILALFFIIPAILYLILYSGTASLYIEVDEYGSVRTIR